MHAGRLVKAGQGRAGRGGAGIPCGQKGLWREGMEDGGSKGLEERKQLSSRSLES